jgi:hypothetical protein
VVGGELALQTIDAEFEWPQDCGCVVDQHLSLVQRRTIEIRAYCPYVQRLWVCVDHLGGLTNRSERRQVENDASDIGSRHLLLDGVLGELEAEN